MKVNGSKTGCMAREHSPGAMVVVTTANTRSTRRTGMESSCGQMAARIKVTGLMASSMALACKRLHKANGVMALGIKVEESKKTKKAMVMNPPTNETNSTKIKNRLKSKNI